MKRASTVIALAALIAISLRGGAQEAESYQKVLQSHADSIVTLRVLSKIESSFGGQSQSQEMRTEIQGVVVDKEGLVMVSTLFMNPYSMNLTEAAATVKMTPTSIKVLFGGDDKEYTAFLAATDTKLNLSFIQIEDLSGKTLVPANLSTSATPMIGDRVVSVSRMSRGYDYSVFYQTGHINGEIARPRHAWAIEGISGFGLPVYKLNNELIGVLTSIPSTIKEDSQNPDTMGMQMALRMMTGGGGMLQPFLIPASIVGGVIEQAKTRAHEIAARRKAGKPEPEPVPAPAKPPVKKPAPKK